METFYNPPYKPNRAEQAAMYYARRRRRAFRREQPLVSAREYDGPVGAWNALGVDISGMGNSLVLHGGVTLGSDPVPVSLGDWVVGDRVDSAVFDNSTGFFQYAAGPIIDFNFGTADFSMNIWLNPASPWGMEGTTCGIMGQKANSSYGGWQMYHDSFMPGRINFRMAETGGTNETNVTTTSTLSTGVWTMATIVRASGVFTWYLNAVEDETQAATVNFITQNVSGANFQIGYASTWEYYYPGAMWLPAIWPRALNLSEIAELYNTPLATEGQVS